MTQDSRTKVVLAFSGGLDTSFCVPYLQRARLRRHHPVRRHRRRRRRRDRAYIERSRPRRSAPWSTSPSTVASRSGIRSSSRWSRAAQLYQGAVPGCSCSDRYVIVEEPLAPARALAAPPPSPTAAPAWATTRSASTWPCAPSATYEHPRAHPRDPARAPRQRARLRAAVPARSSASTCAPRPPSTASTPTCSGVTTSGSEIDGLQRARPRRLQPISAPARSWPEDADARPPPLRARASLVAARRPGAAGPEMLRRKLNASVRRLRRRPRHLHRATPPSASRAASCSSAPASPPS